MTRKLKRKAKIERLAPPEDVRYPELETMLQRMKAIQDDWAAGRERFLLLESAALKFMKDHNITSYDRGPVRGSAKWPTGEEVDWEGIKVLIGPKRWKQILSEPLPDKDKLTALVQLGEVDAAELAEFVTDKPIKPSITLTRRAV